MLNHLGSEVLLDGEQKGGFIASSWGIVCKSGYAFGIVHLNSVIICQQKKKLSILLAYKIRYTFFSLHHLASTYSIKLILCHSLPFTVHDLVLTFKTDLTSHH